ncbi:MAG: hypothetical protein QOA17_11400, partial [Nitrososphaeraceae archaeon]|nr:hypothetical protein [Nitrososphaeraceae archaeon]
DSIERSKLDHYVGKGVGIAQNNHNHMPVKLNYYYLVNKSATCKHKLIHLIKIISIYLVKLF